MESPDVAEVAIVGSPDARWGETVVAVVVPRRGCGLTEADVMRQVEGRIARFKLPRKVLFVDELPKTALGKLRREAVRRLVNDASNPDGCTEFPNPRKDSLP
jgi:fatty-acyl-CoA synthase